MNIRFGNKVIYKWCFLLAVTVNASIALFKGNQRPCNVVIDHPVAEKMQVNPLGCSI